MRKIAIAAISALFGPAVLGQDLFECVDLDVRNSLLFSARTETAMSVTRTLPDDMSGYRAPAGFELIGTAVRGEGTMTTVAFKSALPVAEAFAALLASLEADGWASETSRAPRQTFNVTGEPLNGTVCRDGERGLLSVRDVGDVRYATVNWFEERPARACNAEDPRLASGGLARFETIRAQMPTLDFPSSARPADGRGFGLGSGGSGDMVSTASRIESPDTAATLNDHLASQMTAQGWRRDAVWSGSLTSGSTWTRQGDDGEPYWGALEIIGFGDVYDVTFMLIAKPL